MPFYENTLTKPVGAGTLTQAAPLTVVGPSIDRLGFGAAELEIQYNVLPTITLAKVDLLVKAGIQDSADGNTWGVETVLNASTTSESWGTGITGAAKVDVDTYGVNLAGYDRYIRFNMTGSVGATASGYLAGCAVLGNSFKEPI